MNSETLDTWLDRRIPDVPTPFLPKLLKAGGDEPMSSAVLGDLGIERIAGTLDHAGQDREAAFILLAGDAFLTYACEALAECGDVESGLRELLDRVGECLS